MMIWLFSLFYTTQELASISPHTSVEYTLFQRPVLHGIFYTSSTNWHLWTSRGTITHQDAVQKGIQTVSQQQVCFKRITPQCIKVGEMFPCEENS